MIQKGPLVKRSIIKQIKEGEPHDTRYGTRVYLTYYTVTSPVTNDETKIKHEVTLSRLTCDNRIFSFCFDNGPNIYTEDLDEDDVSQLVENNTLVPYCRSKKTISNTYLASILRPSQRGAHTETRWLMT